MQYKLIYPLALAFALLNTSHAVELTPQRPSIPITIDIAERPTARVDTTLIQYGTYNFVVSFKYNGVPIDLTDATATYINAKLTTDALAGTGDLIFNDNGIIDSKPHGIVSFPVRAGYLDAANAKVRFEFRVYRQESSVPDESVDIRSYVDLYVVRSTLTGTEDPWVAPSPVESYYTKAEVNSILANNVTSVESPTWSDSYDVTVYNLFADTISGIQDPGEYIQFGDEQIIISANSGGSTIAIGNDTIGTGFDGTKITGDVVTTGSLHAGSTFSVVGGGAFGGDLNVGSGADIVADGRAAVVTARSASEMSMIDYGVVSMTSGISNITFTSPFASAPVLVATYAGTDPAAAALTGLDITEITASGAKVEGDSSGTHSINWIAIGQK